MKCQISIVCGDPSRVPLPSMWLIQLDLHDQDIPLKGHPSVAMPYPVCLLEGGATLQGWFRFQSFASGISGVGGAKSEGRNSDGFL